MYTEEDDGGLDYSQLHHNDRAITEMNDISHVGDFSRIAPHQKPQLDKKVAINRSVSNNVGRLKPQNASVPSLDLSNLNHVKDYKQWY